MAHMVVENIKMDEDVKKRMESNLRHLETIMQDVKDGKAHFAEHDLIEED